MKKISFQDHVLPHLVAPLVFLLTTVFFFSPVFFENKALVQHDIQQFLGASKELRDFRDATGKEGLWANSMFSGMPAYLVNLDWSDGAITSLKKVLAIFLPHPVSNIFLAFVCYYVLLLVFRIRTGFAIAGALAFGLSSFMIIGLVAGHNARIGAIAFMPLVVAGVHLVFSNRRLPGFALTALGMALHLRENHLQMTYYLLLLVLAYGLVALVYALREKVLKDFFVRVGVLVPAVLIGVATFFGPLWAISEYTRYSIRGPSEIAAKTDPEARGLSKAYAFDYSNGPAEPFTLLIPNFLGGATADYLVRDEKSETYRALVNARDQQLANQLAAYSGAYWGPQSNTAPYYAGAVVVALVVVGLFFAPRKQIFWLAPAALLGVAMSWGDNFAAFNYFLFDYLPGYNKFRSVTFALIIPLFAMPLLGLLGLEELLKQKWNEKIRTRALAALFAVPALCLFIALIGNFGPYLRPGETELPTWFWQALKKDRLGLLRADAWRSFWFSLLAAVAIFAAWRQWIKTTWALPVALTVLVAADLFLLNRRYISEENYQRKSSRQVLVPAEADSFIAQDKNRFRVFNLQGPFNEARTSYFHHSVGGYHGAKLRRYQDLIDSAINREYSRFIAGARQGNFDTQTLPVLNMLNTKYIVYGPEKENVIENPYAAGPAWFVSEIISASSPAGELMKVQSLDIRRQAVVDQSKFKIETQHFLVDSMASVEMVEHQPNKLVYRSRNNHEGFLVFSEIFYQPGWRAAIDGAPAPLLRANYVLRALQVPAGEHLIEMQFDPACYRVGNPITAAASWAVLLIFVASVAALFRKELK
jgi:hypothetical protein